MPVEHLLDLGGEDLEPGDVDHVLLAVTDEEVPLLVHRRDVARQEEAPAIRRLPEGGAGLVGPVPVSRHHLRARDGQLAFLAGRQRPRPIVGVDDAGVGVGQGNPDRPRLAPTGERVRMGHGRGLRHAVAFDQPAPAPGDPLELLRHRQR